MPAARRSAIGCSASSTRGSAARAGGISRRFTQDNGRQDGLPDDMVLLERLRRANVLGRNTPQHVQGPRLTDDPARPQRYTPPDLGGCSSRGRLGDRPPSQDDNVVAVTPERIGKCTTKKARSSSDHHAHLSPSLTIQYAVPGGFHKGSEREKGSGGTLATWSRAGRSNHQSRWTR